MSDVQFNNVVETAYSPSPSSNNFNQGRYCISVPPLPPSLPPLQALDLVFGQGEKEINLFKIVNERPNQRQFAIAHMFNEWYFTVHDKAKSVNGKRCAESKLLDSVSVVNVYVDQPRENFWYMHTYYEPCSGTSLSQDGIPCSEAIIDFAYRYQDFFHTFVVGFSELLGDPRYRGKAKEEFEGTNVVLLKREENEWVREWSVNDIV